MRKQWCMGLLCCLLGLAGRAQVNLQTGSAEYRLPIYNFSDSRSGLATSVGIAYFSGNGLRIDAQASNTGLGWALNAGGYIERIQKGEPDDQYCRVAAPVGADEIVIKRELSDWSVFDRYYPNGYLYSTYSLQAQPKQLAILPRFKTDETKDFKQTPNGTADREQDVFVADLNGRSVKFVIGRSNVPGVDPAKIVCLDDSKLIFDVTTVAIPDAYRRTMITTFSITDETGIKYTFSDEDYTYVSEQEQLLSIKKDPSVTVFPFSVFTNRKLPDYTINRWNLSQITNTLTGESILFNYEQKDLEVKMRLLPSLMGNSKLLFNNYVPQDDQLSYMYQNAWQRINRLKSIILPNSDRLIFSYATNFTRYDVLGDAPLSQVDLYKSNNLLSSFSLNYGYLYKKSVISDITAASLSEDNKRYLRLALTGFSNGKGMVPDYQFEYYTGSENTDVNYIVPQRFCLSRDWWGYYNDNAVLNGDEGLTGNPLLTGFSDHTVDFLKNLNNCRTPKAEYAKLGLLRKVKLPEGGALTYYYTQRKNQQNEFIGGVSVSKTIIEAGEEQPDQVFEYKYILENGSSSLWGAEAPTSIAPAVTYFSYQKTISRVNPGNQASAMPYDLNFFVGTGAKIGGDLITAGVLSKVSATLSVLHPALLMIAYIKITEAILEFINTVSDGFLEFKNTEYPLDYPILSNPLPAYYTRVEVNNPSTGTGKIVYHFSTLASNDFLIDAAGYAFPFSNKQRIEDWRCGLPVKTEYYNDGGDKIREVSSDYTFTSTVLGTDHASRKIGVNHYMSNRYDETADNNSWVSESYLSYDDYNVRTGRSFTTATAEKQYEAGLEIAGASSTNTYDMAHNTLRKTESLNSKGQKVGQTFYYPYDYNTGLDAGLDVLKSQNVLLPVTTVSWVEKNGSKMVTGFTTSTYTILWGNNVKVQQTYTSRLTDPVTHTLPDAVDPDNLYNYPTLNLVAGETTTYNVYGLPISKTDAHGRVAGFVYDNRNQLTGEVTGASHTEIACTSFESTGIRDFDHSNPNGLDLGNDARLNLQLGQVKDDQAFTGEHAYHLGTSGSFTFNLNTQRASVFSFWASSTGFTVTNAGSLRTSGPSINGWTYYEYDVPANAPAPVITGSGAGAFIDEVRLYPAGSRMTTTTYNAAGLASSQCDANNRVVYSEYDALWRPVKLRDAYRNVIKTYEYHYKGN